ncbi:hypothetical protein BGX20_000712, partial [Mortierella sp. AD010]
MAPQRHSPIQIIQRPAPSTTRPKTRSQTATTAPHPYNTPSNSHKKSRNSPPLPRPGAPSVQTTSTAQTIPLIPLNPTTSTVQPAPNAQTTPSVQTVPSVQATSTTLATSSVQSTPATQTSMQSTFTSISPCIRIRKIGVETVQSKEPENKESIPRYVYPQVTKDIIKRISKMLKVNPEFYTN